MTPYRQPLDPAAIDRALGAVLGMAIGDALGTPLEFEARDAKPVISDMIGGGWLNLKPGVWTDDTALALALAEALLASPKGHLDPAILARECAAYMTEGKHHPAGRCIDIGGTTASALRSFLATGEPVGPDDPGSAGNGSLMRLAPVALGTSDPEQAARLARAQSKVTHAAPACLDACEAFAVMMVEAIATGNREQALDACANRPFADNDVGLLAQGAWASMQRDDVKSGGYVIDTLCASLWSVGTTRTFEDAVVRAVNLAGDADTTGAVTGMLAGAIYGASSIPERWLAQLAWREKIHETGMRLLAI